MFVKVQEAPVHQSQVYGHIKILQTIFEKGHPRNIPVKLFKIGPMVREENIFTELLKKFHFIAMATRVFDRIKFCEPFLKRASQETFLPSLVQIGPAVWEETMFKEIVDDARLPFRMLCSNKLTSGPRWPWISHLNF